jgi:hypothetical protein
MWIRMATFCTRRNRRGFEGWYIARLCMCVYIEMYLKGLDRSDRKRFIG